MRLRAETSVAVLCAVVTLLIFWSAAAWTPFHDWNAARLYPSYLLAAGEPIYPGPTAGIVTGWIYGPLLPLLLTPATLVSDPTWAMVTAGWINIAVFVGPFIWIVDALLGAGLWWSRRWSLIVLATLGFILLPTSPGRLVYITCDQLAIGFGCGACFMLHQAARAPGWGGRGLAAATLAVLAVWTKQTAVLLPVAQVAFLWLHRSRLEAFRYAVQVAIVLVGALGLAIVCFGWSELWFNLAWIPSHHPFATGFQSLTTRILWALLYVGPMLAATHWAWDRWPQPNKTGESHLGFARQLLFVGIALSLTGVLAAAKAGGDENSFHFVYFFALATVTVFSEGLRPRLLAAGGSGMGLACALLAGAVAWTMQGVAPVRLAPTSQIRRAVLLAEGLPEQVAFPRNPLVTWITDRKAYHLEWGLMDQSMAGVPLGRAQFLAGMPLRLNRLVYPMRGRFFLMQLFPSVREEAVGADLAIYQVDLAPSP